MPIFQSRFSECLKHIELESRRLRENIRIIASGQGRTVHFNNLSDSINNVQQILELVKKMSLRDDVIKEEVNKRVSKIIDNAVFLAKKEIENEKAIENVITNDAPNDMARNEEYDGKRNE